MTERRANCPCTHRIEVIVYDHADSTVAVADDALSINDLIDTAVEVPHSLPSRVVD